MLDAFARFALRIPSPRILALSALLVAPSALPGAEQTVEQYRLWEVEVPAAGITPTTDPRRAAIDALVTSPAGEVRVVPAFAFRPFTRRRLPDKDARGREELRPAGPPQWRVRFASGTTGVFRVRFLLRGSWPARAAAAGIRDRELGRTSFRVVPGSSPGFLRVNRRIPSRLAFDTGKGFFALGHNVCWVKRTPGTYAYDDYLQRMHAAGENYTRVWLCTWGLSLDARSPYAVDHADAWRLDHVLARARELGIYIKLCLDNFYDFQNNFDASPFNRKNGGPCATRAGFFAEPAAARQYRARLRYLVGRYGAYTSLMAWELWNEMDYALSPYDLDGGDTRTGLTTYMDLRAKLLAPWALRTARLLKRLDPYRHLITTSLGLHTVWDELWRAPELDICQYHSYIHYLDWLREPVAQDAAAFVLRGQAEIERFGKPAFLAEFGYMGEGEASSMNPRDPDGIALHNALWAGLMSGAAGTPMLWWWDNYIAPRNLYYHYRAMAAVLAGVDWNQPLVPMQAQTPELRVLALRGRRQVLLWVQNREHTWYKVLRLGRKPRRLEGMVLALRDFPRGRYRVHWFDPYAGRELLMRDVNGAASPVRLRPPPFSRDLAARIEVRISTATGNRKAAE